MIVQPITALCGIGLILQTNWKLAAGASVFFTFYFLVLGRLGKAMRRARKKSLEHLGDMTGTMLQTFGVDVTAVVAIVVATAVGSACGVLNTAAIAGVAAAARASRSFGRTLLNGGTLDWLSLTTVG